MDGCSDSAAGCCVAPGAGAGGVGVVRRGKRERRRKGKENGARRWKRWLERARARGTSEMELVVELRLCRGLPLLKVAEVLGLKLPMVQKLWRLSRGGAGAVGGVKAPKSEGDFAALREQMGMVLWQTLEATFTGLMPDANGEARKRPVPMLGVRIRALKQMAKLYGVDPKVKVKAETCRAEACATPEQIAGLVRERLEERGK